LGVDVFSITEAQAEELVIAKLEQIKNRNINSFTHD